MDITNEAAKALANAAFKQIDMAALAKKIAPKMAVEIEKAILFEIKRMQWGVFLYDAIQTKVMAKALSERVIEAFAK